MLRSASIKEFRVRRPRWAGGTPGPGGPAGRDQPPPPRPSLPRTLCPRPGVCSSWEIYGGSINGFYRQLLERAEQGWAVGGPSRGLTAKTLKYYGPTYIKAVPCTSSAPLLLTRERGVRPEESSRFQLPAGWPETKCPQALQPRPGASGGAGSSEAAG